MTSVAVPTGRAWRRAWDHLDPMTRASIEDAVSDGWPVDDVHLAPLAATFASRMRHEVLLAASLAVGTGGGATVSFVPLITPEELDAATKASATFRPPGT